MEKKSLSNKFGKYCIFPFWRFTKLTGNLKVLRIFLLFPGLFKM